jgi:hypothetical protein
MAVAVAAGASAAAVLLIGPAAAAIPFALGAGVAAFVAPRATFCTALVAAVAIDTAPIGASAEFTLAAWELPQAVLARMPFKMNPFEIVIAIAFAAVLLRPPLRAGTAPLPPLARCIPFALLAGLTAGVLQGGAFNLSYHEGRGLLFGTAAFAVAWRTGVFPAEKLARLAIAATCILGLAASYRVLVDLNGGRTGLPMEVWFGHETALFLAGGFILGLLLAVRARGDRERILLWAYTALMLAATLMTGRRSGVLVLGAGVLVISMLALPRKPAAMVALFIGTVLAGGLYLNAFWDDASGPLAEPARAVRSQVDPGERDESSDRYRAIERENIQQTLADSPLFGVGFGHPFVEHEELPDLEFWPLQLYTPHDNVLWLWLKTGVLGAAALLGLWVIALKRCLVGAGFGAGRGPVPIEPLFLAAALVMYLAYARVDLAFVTARAAVPLAVMLAVVFSRDWSPGGRNAAS